MSTSTPKKTAIIGAGFAGLAAASTLASQGVQVDIFEKNTEIGGRARRFSQDGFTFDMGPSWYWMPDVFERFFNKQGRKPSDYYELVQLDPSFRIYFGKDNIVDIPKEPAAIYELFESIEKGAAHKLKRFMDGAAYKYEIGVNRLVYKPARSLTEFLDFDLLKGLFKLQVFTSFHKHVRSYFKDERLIRLMEFPVLFLGAMPKQTPAMYSLMNYSGLMQGTWYPMGGFGKVIDGMQELAKSLGVRIHEGEPIDDIQLNDNKVLGISSLQGETSVDALIAAADYHHVEQDLLPEKHRRYSESYWNKRTMAPSSLIFYLGVDKKIEGLQHHNLFFDADFDKHAQQIYQSPAWPEDPLFYVCAPSKTDATVAPIGKENLFVLVPLGAGLEDSPQKREEFYELVMSRLEHNTGQNIKEHVVVKRSYAMNDFTADYNSYKGNAYGLANTLRQTAVLKPAMHAKHLKNMVYAGQLTVPGPGVPPSIISGQVAAQQILNYINNNNN